MLSSGHDRAMGDAPDQVDGAPLFQDVDARDAARLVAMMDATDAWPAVQAGRLWVLDKVGPPHRIAVDVGCGPGTFSALARRLGWTTIDVDRSAAMIEAARGRHPLGTALRADLASLPIASQSIGLVHCERALQWAADPIDALAELWRVTARGGSIAVTDTDWSTLVVDHDDTLAAERLGDAALAWVPHPRFASAIAPRLRDLGATDVVERHEVVTITSWDPDDPAQADGPPGLPLTTIAAAARPEDRASIEADIGVLADRARANRFSASLTLVTTLARRGGDVLSSSP